MTVQVQSCNSNERRCIQTNDEFALDNSRAIEHNSNKFKFKVLDREFHLGGALAFYM